MNRCYPVSMLIGYLSSRIESGFPIIGEEHKKLVNILQLSHDGYAKEPGKLSGSFLFH